MFSAEQFFSFLLAASLVTATPGPDNTMALSIGMSKGRMSGIAFGLGCSLGCLGHTLLTVLGISALITASAEAFTTLKILGGLYLIWLGINALRTSAHRKIENVGTFVERPRKLFIRGLLANALNPKVAMFFLSFLPQFVIQENGSPTSQMALLGITFTAQAVVIFSLIGYFSGTIGQHLNSRPRIGVMLDRMAGAIFVGLGFRLIMSR